MIELIEEEARNLKNKKKTEEESKKKKVIKITILIRFKT